ncbi:hypothetical protein DFJ74DRAFT_693835 [Hyaloraphidium curvatum]|nr:hypothetical protein DFJ74DRAFT_693835 [Hyaloraphidium curvatum]
MAQAPPADGGLSAPPGRPRRPSLVAVDGPAALEALTAPPTVSEVVGAVLAATPFGSPRTRISVTRPTADLAVPADDEGTNNDTNNDAERRGRTDADAHRSAPHGSTPPRSHSALRRIFTDTLRRFTPEPTDLEGPPETDFDREATLARSRPRTPEDETGASEPVQDAEPEPEADHSRLEPPPPRPPGRRRSWVELAADTVMDILLPKDAFDFELSASAGREARFLGHYTYDDLRQYITDFGIKDELAKRGYTDLMFKIDSSDGFVQRLTVTDSSLLTDAERARGAKIAVTDRNFILDLFVRIRDCRAWDFHAYQELVRLRDGDPGFLFSRPSGAEESAGRRAATPVAGLDPDTHHVSICDLPPEEAGEDVAMLEGAFSEPPLNVTVVDWLEIQNPRAVFTKTRPPLPGQRNPGLKVARKVVSLILSLAEWRHRDCLSNCPDNFHNAYLYSRRGFQYLSPSMQGFFAALADDLEPAVARYGLAPVAWAFRLGHLKDRASGKTVVWSSTQEQVYPTSDRMRRYFTSDRYILQAERARAAYGGRFAVDFEDPKVQGDLKAAMNWGELPFSPR